MPLDRAAVSWRALAGRQVAAWRAATPRCVAAGGVAVALLLSLLGGCDREGRPIEHLGMGRLKPGLSVQADVLDVFGTPDRIVAAADGVRILQFPMGPAGARTFFAWIGPDGRLIEVRNVLVAETFAKVRPGLSQDDVQLLLGRPGSKIPRPLRQQSDWTWRCLEGGDTKQFSVTFDAEGKVTSAGVEPIQPEGGR
jgi:outer membrane protein assembly factor BamE (lipoprotein component of BamABCDE complex)